MSIIKQVLLLKQQGETNRGIARKLPINKETVNGYMRIIASNEWRITDLLRKDDPELERMFHAGSPAYTDKRMEEFLRLLPYFRDQLTDRKSHVTRQLLWEEYRRTHPDGYGKSQFYDHLKQNLVAQRDVVTVLSQTYKPGEKLMVDFAGDKLSYTDPETGEMVKAEVFVGCMPFSDYIYVVCVPSQRTEDFVHAIRMCLEHMGGVPPIITPDNLKAAVIRSDRHEPDINSALRDMGNHYGFVVMPCDPGEPTQKALVEDGVRIAYTRIAAKLRGRPFHSLHELNRAVWEANAQLNQTRMQKRPYTREERFHAMEKPLLRPLPEEIFEMRRYADLKVQCNGFVELRHDKVTHFYSVPYIHIGRQARVIFTRSWVRIYVDGRMVATHTRKHQFGYTYEPEHMASNSRAKETHQLDKLSLRDGMQLMLQHECDTRRTNRIARLVKNAGFRLKASLEELETDTTRGISAAAVTELASGNYIQNGRTIIINGPTGTGKSYLACALGDRACREGVKTLYFTMNHLIESLRLAHLEGHETGFLRKLSSHALLIIDDFGMARLEGQAQHDFEQIVDDRYNRKALILASQLPVTDWYSVFQSELIAEACLDRLVHKSTRFELKGESLRKKY